MSVLVATVVVSHSTCNSKGGIIITSIDIAIAIRYTLVYALPRVLYVKQNMRHVGQTLIKHDDYCKSHIIHIGLINSYSAANIKTINIGSYGK